MVFALAGDSTTTSAFAINLVSTLARTVNPHESTAANARNGTLQFQLEQPRQQTRCAEPGTLGNRVEIAWLPWRQTGKNRVRRRGARLSVPWSRWYRDLELFQNIVRGLDNLCTVAQKRVGAAVAARQHIPGNREHVAALFERASCGDERPALLPGFDDDDGEIGRASCRERG